MNMNPALFLVHSLFCLIRSVDLFVNHYNDDCHCVLLFYFFRSVLPISFVLFIWIESNQKLDDDDGDDYNDEIMTMMMIIIIIMSLSTINTIWL